MRQNIFIDKRSIKIDALFKASCKAKNFTEAADLPKISLRRLAVLKQFEDVSKAGKPR